MDYVLYNMIGVRSKNLSMEKMFKKKIYNAIRRQVLPQFYIKYLQPRIVFMTGMPRSGTTLSMRYFVKHPKMTLVKSTYNNNIPLRSIAPRDHIALEKSTRYLRGLPVLYNRYGNQAWYICIVRDPRDIFLSLSETDIHPEVPRTVKFWEFWYNSWQGVFKFSRKRHVPIVWLRYEDLVVDPVKIKRAFQIWLSLPQSDLTSDYDSDQYYAIPGRGEDWKANSHQQVHQKSISRWKSNSYSVEIRNVLDFYINNPQYIELMHQFGYTSDGYTTPSLQENNFPQLK